MNPTTAARALYFLPAPGFLRLLSFSNNRKSGSRRHLDGLELPQLDFKNANIDAAIIGVVSTLRFTPRKWLSLVGCSSSVLEDDYMHLSPV
jgi:hypothetical protein